MLFELIAAFSAGVGAGGLAYLARRLSGGRAPGWLVPAAAAAGMFAAAIGNEYGWRGRVEGGLPEGVATALTVEKSDVYRPWSYLTPVTTRLAAVDTRTLRAHPERPDEWLAETLFFSRWAPTRRMTSVFDCAGRRRADLVGGVTLRRDGGLDGATWVGLAPDDPFAAIVCGEGRS